MVFSSSSRQAARLLLAVFVVAAGGVSVWAEIGPQPPQPRPVQDNAITKALRKMMKKPNPDTNAPAAPDAADSEALPAADLQKDGKSLKPTVVAPADDTLPTAKHPSDTPSGIQHPPLLTQPVLTNAKVETPEIDPENPPAMGHPKLDDPANPLGFTDAENKLKKYTTLVDAQRFYEAKPGLLQLRQWLVELTEAHIGLYKTLNQVPSARGQAELEKELALQFAQLRDRAMMQSARIYISEKDYPKAVKELTDVVKSQPKSKIGLRSYELLQEIGFTEKLQLAQ